MLRYALSLTALLCALASVYAQDDGVLVSMGFENGVENCITMDKDAKLTQTKDPDTVYAGTGALELSYLQRALNPTPGQEDLPGMIAIPFPEPKAQLKGVSFALAAAHSTAVAVMLSEGDGGPRYATVIWCEAGEWQVPRLGLGSFQHADDSPVDPDGKLTPEKVTGMALLDMGNLLRAMIEQNPMFYISPPEDQRLWLDEVKLLSKNPEEEKPAREGVKLLNDYSMPLRGVLFLGGKSVTVGKDESEQGAHVKLTYTIPPRTVLGIANLAGAGNLAGAKAIRFRVKSTSTVTMIVNMEEKRGEGDGSNYNAQLTINGLQPWKEITVPISDFHIDEGGLDPNGKLDLDKVDAVVMVDVSAAGAPGDITNTLWLSDLVAVK